jgi:hypothetical protein
MRYISKATLPKSLKPDQVLIHHRVPLSVDQPVDGEGEGHGFRPYVTTTQTGRRFENNSSPANVAGPDCHTTARAARPAAPVVFELERRVANPASARSLVSELR